MEQKTTYKPTTLFYIGLAANVLSFGLFLLLSHNKELQTQNLFEENGMFFFNYGIAAIYFITILIDNFRVNRWNVFKLNRKLFICALLLFVISAFGLNLVINIFSDFSHWVDVYLIVMHLSLLGACFHDSWPRPLKFFNLFVMGLGSVMALYFTIYLLPSMPFAVIGFFFFGLSLHMLAPAFVLATFIVQFVKARIDWRDTVAYSAGLALPVLVTTIFLVQWNKTAELIHEAHASIITRPDNTLPTWVLLSQRLSDDFFTERIIKGDLIYTSPNSNSGFWDFGMSGFGEIKEHDPLVFVGMALIGEIPINKDDRIKILQSQFDARHHSQRKLWRGNDLVTSDVLTNVRVYPEYRLAYTEKIITIRNVSQRGWRGQQEAAYTFHLPEGSVATSLSLWINGIEEKSRLTTRQKADSAYVSIVGVERRDPALLHWQEGNRLTVTVFPCTPEENRMFKIGVTTPLEKRDNKLVLQNIYFEGPDVTRARETTVVQFENDQIKDVVMPAGFTSKKLNNYQHTGNYRPYWEVECEVVPISSKPFSFNKKTYVMQELKDQMTEFKAQQVFLDVNGEWTSGEFEAVWEAVKSQKVYVYDDRLYQLTAENKEQIYELLADQRFSLFPVHLIKDPANSLLVSKSPSVTPNLLDLEGSGFVTDLQAYLKKLEQPICMYNLGQEVSPYLKTLKEFRVFNYTSGDVKRLGKLIEDNQFPTNQGTDNSIVIDNAALKIQMDTVATALAKAPDHLMRLFAYNDILKKTGRNYFEDRKFTTDEMIGIANEAFVVSPISSLVVLETVADYERFDIGENNNSLDNATVSSSGAVPEPHEWALIILTGMILLWLSRERLRAIIGSRR